MYLSGTCGIFRMVDLLRRNGKAGILFFFYLVLMQYLRYQRGRVSRSMISIFNQYVSVKTIFLLCLESFVL